MSVRLEIVAKPGARIAGIAWRRADVVVAVRERAADGKANAAILRAVADWLVIAPCRVSVVHGDRGRRKLLEIEGVDGPALRERIARLIGG